MFTHSALSALSAARFCGKLPDKKPPPSRPPQPRSHPPRSSPPPAPSTASAPTTGTPRACPPPGTETRQMPRHREAHLTSNALTTPRAIPRRQEINRVCEALSLSAHQPLDSTGEPPSRPDRSQLLCSRQLSVKSSEEGTRSWTPRFPLVACCHMLAAMECELCARCHA